MKEQLEAIRAGALAAIGAAGNTGELEALRVQYLGKKGELTAVLKQMGKLSAEERPVMGQLANAVRADVESAIEQQSAVLAEKALEERLEALAVRGEVDLDQVAGQEAVYLPALYEAETYIAQRMGEMSRAELLPPDGLDRLLKQTLGGGYRLMVNRRRDGRAGAAVSFYLPLERNG